MVGTYDRNKAKREHKQVALEHLASEGELQASMNEVLEGYERRDRDWEEYSWREFEQDMAAVDRTQGERVPYRQMHQTDHQGRDVFTGLVGIENGQDEGSHHALVDPTERDLHGERSLEKIMNEMPCLHCLGEHHPDADCPADEDVRSYNESQANSLDWDDHDWHP